MEHNINGLFVRVNNVESAVDEKAFLPEAIWKSHVKDKFDRLYEYMEKMREELANINKSN